jgi:hypothetical protein
MCKNKKLFDLDFIMMHLLQKEFMDKYLYCYAYGEPYVTHDTIVKMVIVSTSSSSNVLGVVNDNSNHYRNIVMDAMKMNQGHGGQYPIVDEEPNADVTRFFDLLKYFDEPLWDGCPNHSQLSVIAHVFTMKSDHGLSETSYDKIVKWARSILS